MLCFHFYIYFSIFEKIEIFAANSYSANSNGRDTDLSSLPAQLATQESEASKASISSDTGTSVCSTPSTLASDITTTNPCAIGLVPSNTTIPKKIKSGSIITKVSCRISYLALFYEKKCTTNSSIS